MTAGAVRCGGACAPTGTKAYVDWFSRSLAVELGSKGVIVQCVAPNLVASKARTRRAAAAAAAAADAGTTEYANTCQQLARSFRRCGRR